MNSDAKKEECRGQTLSFCDHMSSAWEELYALGELEYKYKFFRMDVPHVSYILNKDAFRMMVNYRLNLSAKKNNAYLLVGFRPPHNYWQVRRTGKTKMSRMEAQEEIMCDPKHGYEAVRRLFKDKGAISKSDIDYSIRLNDDVLIFDDKDKRHEVFRGWTGGYDPGYGGPDDISNKIPRKLKKGWDVTPYASLERRINTLKMLFDGINSYAKLTVNKSVQPINKVPDFRRIYFDTINSERYRFMESFGSEVAQRIDVKPLYDITISLSERTPRINFLDEKSGVFFYTERGGLNDVKFCCELHMPLANAKVKDIDRTYITYNENDETHHIGPINREMIGVYEYVNSLEDTPAGLQRCLERLGYPK